MAYCVIADLYDALDETVVIRLTDDDQTGVINESIGNAAIITGAGIIDSYITQVAALPLTGTIPEILVTINKDLAIYELYARVPTDIPDVWIAKMERGIEMLKSIAAGEISLYPGEETDEDAPGVPQYSARTKVFSATNLAKF